MKRSTKNHTIVCVGLALLGFLLTGLAALSWSVFLIAWGLGPF